MFDSPMKEMQVQIAPESLAELVENLYATGLNEQQVHDEVERIKRIIIADIDQRISDEANFLDEFIDELESAPVQYVH